MKLNDFFDSLDISQTDELIKGGMPENDLPSSAYGKIQRSVMKKAGLSKGFKPKILLIAAICASFAVVFTAFTVLYIKNGDSDNHGFTGGESASETEPVTDEINDDIPVGDDLVMGDMLVDGGVLWIDDGIDGEGDSDGEREPDADILPSAPDDDVPEDVPEADETVSVDEEICDDTENESVIIDKNAVYVQYEGLSVTEKLKAVYSNQNYDGKYIAVLVKLANEPTQEFLKAEKKLERLDGELSRVRNTIEQLSELLRYGDDIAKWQIGENDDIIDGEKYQSLTEHIGDLADIYIIDGVFLKQDAEEKMSEYCLEEIRLEKECEQATLEYERANNIKLVSSKALTEYFISIGFSAERTDRNNSTIVMIKHGDLVRIRSAIDESSEYSSNEFLFSIARISDKAVYSSDDDKIPTEETTCVSAEETDLMEETAVQIYEE